MTMRALIGVEIKRFFSFGWNLRLAVLFMPATGLALWQYTASPFVPIFAALFVGLEPQYCNILFRTSNEFEALSLLPVPWKRIVLAKNLGTILITLICLPLVSVPVLYFSPETPPAMEFSNAGLFLLSVIFPLLHAGNLQSVLHPRRFMGWRMDDLAAAVLMAGFLAVFSLPYLVLVEAVGSPILCLVYAAGAGLLWYRYSLGAMARRVSQSTGVLCTTR
jgi:hypothetical protein